MRIPVLYYETVTPYEPTIGGMFGNYTLQNIGGSLYRLELI